MRKILLLVGTDGLAILLGVLIASVFGNSYGDEISPNILLLVLTFFLTRSVLHWALFNSIIKRDLDWTRSIVQSVTIVISLSVVTFTLVALPTYSSTLAGAENIFLFFGNIQSAAFYYLIVPVVTLALSVLLHKVYKLEPW